VKLNNKGFSLVELMVVVAIIGILASVAVPQVNKYMAKARQSEAKTNLGSMYTAMKAFYAEYNVYDNRFQIIGFAPEGKLRYNIGWATSAATALANYGYTAPIPGTVHSNTRTFCPVSGTCQGLTGQGVDADLTAAGAEIAAPTQTFIAAAAGIIANGTGAAATQDQWTINQFKDLQNKQDGTQ
jgi:type IV pilus assembly protein PilA